MLVKSKYRCALILEGDSFTAESLNISCEALQGTLITVSIIYGIPILRSKNLAETVKLMLFTSKQITTNSLGSLKRKTKPPKRKPKLQLYILQGLPNIGVYRANQLLEHFGSVEKVVAVDLEQLVQVKGIGHDTASKIRWSVTNYD